MSKITTPNFMRLIGTVIGYTMWVISGILMFIFWFTAMFKWLGVFGAILACLFPPALTLFPIIFWIVEGVFPIYYFIIWIIGIIGVIISAFSNIKSDVN